MIDNYVLNVALLERLKVADLRIKTGKLDPFIRTFQECYAWTDYIKNRFIIIFIFLYLNHFFRLHGIWSYTKKNIHNDESHSAFSKLKDEQNLKIN